jgi:Bacterial SH3 domain
MIRQARPLQNRNSFNATNNLTHNCSIYIFPLSGKNVSAKYKFKFIKYLLCLVTVIVIGMNSFAQSYLGTVTKQANFREGAGKEYDVIGSLKTGSQIFIVSLETENDFYNIIDIRTNKEGYIHKSFVKVGKQIKENDQAVFSSSGETTSYNPEVEVFNNTNLTLTLKLNSASYSFNPKEKRTLTIEPGSISYRASAPGIIPNIGTQNLQSNQGYTWQFYIITRYK